MTAIGYLTTTWCASALTRLGTRWARIRIVAGTASNLRGWLLSALSFACPIAVAGCPDPAKMDRSLGHTVACAGKSSCLATDTLTVTPSTGTTSPIVAICLKVGEKLTLIDSDVHAPSDDKPVPINLALLPLLTRQLEWEASKNNTSKTLTDALSDSALGTVRFEVLLQDKQGKGQLIPVDVDGGELWRTRRLMLQIDDARCNTKLCAVGSHLRVNARGFEAWRAATKKDLAKVTVLIDGVRFPGLFSVIASSDHELDFLLSRDLSKPESAKAWEALLQQTDSNSNKNRGVKIALSDDDGHISSEFLSQVVIDSGSKVLFGALLLIVAFAVLACSYRANRLIAIRDDAPTPRLREEMPFSLGRSQMLLWTITVVAAWLFVGLTLGDWSGPNATALILMGISAGTSVGAAVAVQTPPALDAISQQSLTDLSAAETALKAQPMDATALAKEAAAVDQLRKAGLWSRNLFADITSSIGSDKSELHRLQIVTFTMILWIYYLVKFYQTRAMPDLTDSQLALLGVSAGTYVGYKFVKEG